MRDTIQGTLHILFLHEKKINLIFQKLATQNNRQIFKIQQKLFTNYTINKHPLLKTTYQMISAHFSEYPTIYPLRIFLI